MNKNVIIAFTITVFIITSTVAYTIGYHAKPSPKYIYVRYGEVQNNLFKVLEDCGIQTDIEQREAVFQRLKTKR